MERMEKKPKKRDVSDFAVTKKKIGPRDKSDFAKGFVPKKKDVSDFAVNTKTKTKTKKVANANKNKVVKKKTTTVNYSKQGSPYKIKSGDTLSAIAKKRGTTVAKIMAANPSIKDKNKIFAGKTLKMPGIKNLMSKPTPRPKAKPARKTNASKMGLEGPKVGVRNGSKPKKKTSNAMSTKTSKFFKGTNITPTKTQRQRMRKRMMGST